MDAALITRSLEDVAERIGDPAGPVYARLFAQAPEMELLFVRDTQGLIRGQMLAVVFDTLLDFVGKGAYARGLILSELVNHNNLGVPAAEFASFFHTVRDVCREALGPDWTAETDTAWAELLAGLDAAIREQALASGLD